MTLIYTIYLFLFIFLSGFLFLLPFKVLDFFFFATYIRAIFEVVKWLLVESFSILTLLDGNVDKVEDVKTSVGVKLEASSKTN